MQISVSPRGEIAKSENPIINTIEVNRKQEQYFFWLPNVDYDNIFFYLKPESVSYPSIV